VFVVLFWQRIVFLCCFAPFLEADSVLEVRSPEFFG